MSKTSPTQRSLAHLRKQGYTVAITERWNPFARRRQDLFDFGDLLAIKEGESPLIVQTTSQTNRSARVKKILSIPAAKTWLSTGGRIVVHGWSKKGKRGCVKKWCVCEEWITSEAEFV